MLTESQYRVLLRYQNSFVEVSKSPDNITLFLLAHQYIWAERIEYRRQLECEVTCIKIFWRVTPEGIAALDEFEEVLEKNAKAERQQRFQNQLSIAQTLIAIVTFLLGLIVEHYAGIVGSLGRWIENFIQ